MAPVRVDGSHFSPDTRAFLEHLSRYQVQYLIVGGEAVIFHGYARLTGDTDFVYGPDRANAQRLFAALEAFWAGDIPGSKAAGGAHEAQARRSAHPRPDSIPVPGAPPMNRRPEQI